WTPEELERARSGGGPTFIEALTYRMGAHATSDDPTRYRSRAEEDYWRDRDPIDRLAAHLRAEGTPETFFEELQEEEEAFGAEIRDCCHSIGTPPQERNFAHVYATENRQARSDREGFVSYQGGTSPDVARRGAPDNAGRP